MGRTKPVEEPILMPSFWNAWVTSATWGSSAVYSRRQASCMGTKSAKHGVDRALVGIGPVHAFPALANLRHLGQLLDVQVLAQAHGTARLGHGNLHAVFLEDVDEDHRGRQHIGVCGGAAPVEDDAFDRAAVAAGVDVVGCHAHGIHLISC